MKLTSTRSLLAELSGALIVAAWMVFSPGHVSAQPMTFSLEGNGGNCNDCIWIAAKGEITANSVDQFRAAVKRSGLPTCPNVLVHSPGGSLLGGMRLGEAFRDLRCKTIVGSSKPEREGYLEMLELPGECLSSCAYAFLGGLYRSMIPGSRYGVHQHYISGKRSAVMLREQAEAESVAMQVFSGLLVEYVMRMGVDPKLITLAALQPDRGNIPPMSREAMVRMKVLTDAPPEPADWKLVPSRNASGLFATISQPQTEKEPHVATMHCKASSPGQFHLDIWVTLGDEYLKSLQQSGPEEHEITMNGRARVRAMATYQDLQGTPTLRVAMTIPASTLQTLARDRNWEWTADVPRAMGNFWSGLLSTRDLAPTLTLLQRNCTT